MRETSTNVFNGGLNYDLNPMTTPNNVLTDCVNGSFITFNGDELALQNDAGNTKIAVPGSGPVEYVTLSPGFQPLGIKEYGGVLYIVSAKTPDTSSWTAWSNTSWSEGSVVYREVLDEIVYYRSLTDITGNELNPTTTNTDLWEELGSKEDAINKLSQVEFGSYPSPEAAEVRQFPGIPREYNNTLIDLTTLYKKLIINDALFKSSRYIIFDGAESLDIDLSRVSGVTYNGVVNPFKLFYKFKLYHYLSNGYLDLTERVEDKYQEYLENNDVAEGTYRWFTDDTFRFYSPSQFKGKLAISLEIEDLERFALYGYPGFSFDGTNYTFKLNIEAIGNGFIDVSHARVEIWLDDVPYDFGGGVYYQDVVASNNVANFELSALTIDDANKEVSYRVTPVIDVEGTNYAEGKYEDAYDDMPQEWIDQYVIEGSRLVDTFYDDIQFVKDSPGCYMETSYIQHEVLTMTTLDGTYLDIELAPANPQVPHVFVRKDIYDATPDYDTVNGVVTIATFQTSVPATLYPVNVEVLQTDVYASILTMFSRQSVAEFSLTCIPSNIIVPDFIGISESGGIYLMNDGGETKLINMSFDMPETNWGADHEYQTIRYSIDYDRNNKLLFVGEAEGYLSIVDLSDVENPLSKRIRVTTDSTDVCTVKVVTSGTNSNGGDENKEVLMGTRNKKMFRHPFRTTYTSYTDGDAREVLVDHRDGSLMDFAYDGRYLGIDDRLSLHTSTNLNDGLSLITDLDYRGYKIGVGQQYYWWLGHRAKGGQEDLRLLYSPRSDYDSFTKRHGFSGDMLCVDLEMLDGDDLIILDRRTRYGMRRVNGIDGDVVDLNVALFNDPSSYYYNTSLDVYSGGMAYDQLKYVYISFKNYTGLYFTDNVIMKYNVYKGVGEDLWENKIDTWAWFPKIFIY